jgi:hypothetical protein
MAKRRKLSHFTTEETASIIRLLQRFEEELDDEDEDGVEFLNALTKVLAKLKEVKVRFRLSAHTELC